MRTENNQLGMKKSNLAVKNHLKYLKDEIIYLIAILALAIFLRFWNLGYSEFQGDEARAILKTTQIIDGAENAIFNHKKGPTELLLQIPSILFLDIMNEFTCRLTYAVAGVVSIVALYIVVKRLFDKKVALLSALLLSICGFLVGYSRIVQYQSMVILTTELSLFFMIMFYNSAHDRDSKSLLLASFFYSLSLLSHYETLFLLPVLIYLVYMKYGLSMFKRKNVLYAIAIVTTISLAFYIPFILNPTFGSTFESINEKVGTSDAVIPLYFNFESFLIYTSLYTSYYFTLLLVVATLYVIFIIIHGKKRRWQFDLILLWFLSFLIPYLFFVKSPYTHFYSIYPPWIIMASLGISKFQENCVSFQQSISNVFSKTMKFKYISRVFGKIILVIFAILIVLSNYYVVVAFLQHEKDPSDYPFIYYRKPRYGIFGFPHKSGWKTAGWYVREHSVPDDRFFTNEDNQITRYYIGLEITDLTNAKFILLAPNPWDADKKELDKYFNYAEKYCSLVAIVYFKGENTIYIYEKGSTRLNPELLFTEDYEAKFDKKYGTP